MRCLQNYNSKRLHPIHKNKENSYQNALSEDATLKHSAPKSTAQHVFTVFRVLTVTEDIDAQILFSTIDAEIEPKFLIGLRETFQGELNCLFGQNQKKPNP
jgi:hypothetical protein